MPLANARSGKWRPIAGNSDQAVRPLRPRKIFLEGLKHFLPRLFELLGNGVPAGYGWINRRCWGDLYPGFDCFPFWSIMRPIISMVSDGYEITQESEGCGTVGSTSNVARFQKALACT
jgi:hypothetical protein